MGNTFDRWYKCKICGELLKEDWMQGVLQSTTTTNTRLIHLLKHNFDSVDETNEEFITL